MADGQSQHDKLLVVNLAEDPIVSHPITPQTVEVTTQWFAEMTWVFAALDMLEKPVEQAILDRAIQLAQLFTPARGELGIGR